MFKSGVLANLTATINQFGSRIWQGRLTRNALVSLIQPLTGMFCLFGAYRILTDKVGVEGVGLWSLLVAGSLVARLADVSGSGGLARFVAVERAKTGGGEAVTFIHTVTLTTLIFNALAGGVFWLASGWLVTRFVEPAMVGEARRMIPWAVLSVVVATPVATTLCSAIDGTQRADQRAVLLSVSSVVFLLMTWRLVPQFGGVGFAVAQLLQQVFVIAGAWWLVRRQVPGVGLMPYRWRTSIFKETVGFGAMLQATALASLLTEPTAKLMLNHWGGLALVGYYEFALRLLLQLRGLLVAAVQPIMAAVAGLGDDRVQLANLLEKATRLSIFAGVGLTLGAVLVSPLYSYLMLGHVRAELVTVVGALAFAFGVNAISVPFYFAAMGRGVMRWNLITQAQAAATILIFGSVFGIMFGGPGVIASLALAIVIASGVTLLGNAWALGLLPVAGRLSTTIILGALAMAVASAGGVTLVLWRIGV
jgi:O-antigen/teichoic acid export membrane protein